MRNQANRILVLTVALAILAVTYAGLYTAIGAEASSVFMCGMLFALIMLNDGE